MEYKYISTNKSAIRPIVDIASDENDEEIIICDF